MILRRIQEWARVQPDKTALIYNDMPLSYARFVGAIALTRDLLARQDLPPRGVAVVLACEWRVAWPLVMAARALGLTTVCSITISAVEGLNLEDVVCLLVPARERELHQFQSGALAGLKVIFVPDPFQLEAEPGPAAEAPENPPWGGHILYSSGTTGTYKKILVEGAMEDARNEARARVSGFGGDTVFHAVNFGLWTGIGFKTPSAVWRLGGTVIIDQSPGVYANFLRHDPTYAQTTPEILRAIVDAQQPPWRPSERMSLRVGGGFAPLDLAQKAVERVSRRLLAGFSSTELTTAVMLSPFSTAEDLLWLTPGEPAVVQVADEAGDEAPPDVEGDLRFRLTEMDSKGYLGDIEATARAFRGGFFYSGDRAVKRADGRVRILGRSGDVINIAGHKRAVGPIEQALRDDLGVDEVCLFTAMADDGVEELAVAVQTSRPLSAEDIRQRLGDISLFGRVRIGIFPQFPRTQTGLAKTRRLELRRMMFEPAAT